MNEQQTWKTLAVSYSLANLWFIGGWKELIFSSTYNYFDVASHTIFELGALLINVLIFTLLFAYLLRLARNKASRPLTSTVFNLIFLALGLTAFCSLSFELVVWLNPKGMGLGNVPLPALVLTVCALLAFREKEKLRAIVENLRQLAFVLWPFTILLLLQAGWVFATQDRTGFEPRQVNRPVENSHIPQKTKVVWVIFDELDYATLEAAQGTVLNLPAFKRLESHSFTASNATSPTDETLTSIPSLLTGVRFKEARHNSANDLLLVTDDDAKFDLTETVNVFRQLGSVGIRSGIVGWYHPYARLFGKDASSIYWVPYSDVRKCSSGLNGFDSCVVGVFLRSLVQVPLANRIDPALMATGEEYMGRMPQSIMYPFIMGKAQELISDADTDFAFLHFSIPHDPFTKLQGADGDADYFSSLRVVDQALQSITDAIEGSSSADKTVLIVTSDHRWRHKTLADFGFLEGGVARDVLNDRRVPFFVKFPHHDEHVAFDGRMNTIVTKAMVEEIFKGNITGPAELETWLQKGLAEPK